MQEKEKRTLRKDAAQNQNLILTEARNLFRENGVGKTSMHQIAKAAGVGQGTLYRRYAHKGELCLALLLDVGQKNYDEILAYLDEHGEEPLEERLKQTLSYALDFVEEQYQLLGAIKAPNCEDDSTLIYRSPVYRCKHEIFQNLLDEIPSVDGSEPLNTTYAADIIMAAMAPNLFQFLREDRGYSKEEILDNLYHVCIRPLLTAGHL